MRQVTTDNRGTYGWIEQTHLSLETSAALTSLYGAPACPFRSASSRRLTSTSSLLASGRNLIHRLSLCVKVQGVRFRGTWPAIVKTTQRQHRRSFQEWSAGLTAMSLGYRAKVYSKSCGPTYTVNTSSSSSQSSQSCLQLITNRCSIAERAWITDCRKVKGPSTSWWGVARPARQI